MTKLTNPRIQNQRTIENPGKSDQNQRPIVILTIFLFAMSLFMKIGLVTSNSISIRGVEENTLFSIQEIMVGDPLYPNPERPPFAVTQYTPFYYLLVAKLSHLFGVIPGEQHLRIYLIGRTLSFALSLGISFLVFITSRKFGASKLISGIGAVTAFIVPIPWYSLLRPDALMAFCGIAAIVLYINALEQTESRKKTISWVLVGVLGYLSFFAKQNGAIFLISVMLYPLTRKRFKEIGTISIGLVAAFLATTLVFSNYFSIIPSESNFFYDHIIGGLDNGVFFPFSYEKLYSIYFSWFFPFFALPLAGVLIVGYSIKEEGYKNTDAVAVVLAISFSIVTLSNLIVGFKIGSAINYMNESMVLSILFLVRLFQVNKIVPPYNPNFDRHIILKSLVFLYLLVLIFHQVYTYQSDIRQSRMLNSPEISNQEEIVDFFEEALRVHPGALIYSNDPLINNIYFPNIIFPQDEVSAYGYFEEQYDYSRISDLINDGTFRYIVLWKDSTFPAEIVGNELTGFELVESTSAHRIYVNTRMP
jgi:hypothetical protein